MLSILKQSCRTGRIVILAASGFLLLPGCEQSLPEITGNEVTITTENFDAEVLQSDIPVLVDFGATWCGPCRRLEPVLAHLSVNYDGRLKVGKVDVDEQPELSAQFEVSGIPAMMLFQDGEVVASQTGYVNLSSLSAWVDGNLPASGG